MNTVQQDSGNPTANLKFYRRILPGLVSEMFSFLLEETSSAFEVYICSQYQ